VTVAFLDPGATYRELRAELEQAFRRVMESGWYIGGEEVAAFEREFAGACGTAHAVGCASGLDALYLALRAAGIGPGDEVIVPAHTFVATWLAVARAGAAIVPVDPDPGTLNMDPTAVEAVITARTAALMPVHLYGQPADMDRLGALARRHRMLLLEDAAQAHGARWNGRPAGELGDIAGFSFYPAKNLGAFGDAGALTTDDADLAYRARRIGNYGSDGKYHHDEIGDNSRLDPLQAAFLRVKLAALPRWNARRAEIAARYRAELEGAVELLTVDPRAEPVWHLFPVRHPDRDRLQERLRARGVHTQIHYPEPPHRAGAFADLGLAPGAFPVTEQAAATLLSLPIGPHLTDEQVQETVTAVLEEA